MEMQKERKTKRETERIEARQKETVKLDREFVIWIGGKADSLGGQSFISSPVRCTLISEPISG